MLLLSSAVLKCQKDFSCLAGIDVNPDNGKNYQAFLDNNNDSIILLIKTLSAAYHELDSSIIHVKSKKLKTLAATRPQLDFLFRKKENRIYNIFVSNNDKFLADSLFTYMTCEAFFGLMAHELAHITEYSKRNSLGIIGIAFQYLFNKKKIEHQADMLVIEKGFEKELIDFKKYVRSSPFTNEKYLRNKKKNYLSVKEIKKISNEEYF